MAGSDKIAARSSTSRSKTEPAQPISEAEGSEVAGQLLKSLKTGSSGIAAVSHEAKLGMMVITILFFAFCFLVYHKMDMHQRQLTQASISSSAEDKTEKQPLDVDAQLASQSEKSAATDPLMNVADLSDGSPFASADSNEESLVTAAQSGQSMASQFGSLTETAASRETQQPADNASPDGFSFDEPLPSESPGPKVAASGSQPLQLESASPQGQDFAALGEPAETEATPEFGAIADAGTSAPTLGADLVSDDEPTMAFGAIEPDQDASTEITLTPDMDEAVPEPRDAEPTLSAPSLSSDEMAFDSNLASEGSAEPGYAVSDSESAIQFQPESASPTERDPEPVMIAMAEPQQDTGFAGGFDAVDSDSGISAGRAPADDSADTVPGFDSADSGSFETQTAETPQAGPFGNQSLKAVTQPGSRANRNSIRTAAGSGADGKFSLAAFNYQNNAVEPAPDDGSAFESIVVQNGDNYSKISKRVYGTVKYFSALAVFNQHRITEPKHMRPGMIVLTPAKEVLEERYPQLFVDSQPKVVPRAEFFLLEDGSPAYRVGERETLSEISKRYLGRSSRWVEILRLNQANVRDPNKLKPGLILALPADATEVNLSP